MFTETATIEGKETTEVISLYQIQGNQPYVFARDYEAEKIANDGTKAYVRYTPPVPAKRLTKTEAKELVKPMYELEREEFHTPTFLDGIDDVDDDEPIKITEISEKDMPVFEVEEDKEPVPEEMEVEEEEA